jgi:crotonobetainyl-CoA:carnitine CoA-transferase CaiB-like acyl-CoA transferase
VSEVGFPLEGVRVLDFTQYVSGPYCAQVMADLGATVLKVERPGRGDVYRDQGPVFLRGESVSFLTLNRGKRSIELDIADPAGRPRLDALLGEADVFLENMRPGTLAKFGLDFESLHERFPRLVYCSISGFGQKGPMARRGGYDLTIQALSGLMALTGFPGGPPAKIPVAALDFGSALYGVIGILSALAQRERTGEGQRVDTSILECALAWLSMHITTFAVTGEEPVPSGTRSPFFAPYEAYQTSSGYIVVVGTGGKEAWERLCGVLGLDRLVADPRFADNSSRVANAEELRVEIEAVMTQQPTAHWEEVLAEAQIPHAPVQKLAEVLASDQVEALGALAELDHPDAGTVPIVRLPVNFSAARSTSDIPPPRLGENGDRDLQ